MTASNEQTADGSRIRGSLWWMAAVLVVLVISATLALFYVLDRGEDVAAMTSPTTDVFDEGREDPNVYGRGGTDTSGPAPSRTTATTFRNEPATAVSVPGGRTSSSSTTSSTSTSISTTQLRPTTTTSVAAAVTTGVRGRVIDTTSGTGVAGATVKVEGAVATTGSDGTFALQADVDVGESVLAEMPGYISARRVIRSIGVDGWAELEIGLLSITSPDAPPPPPT